MKLAVKLFVLSIYVCVTVSCGKKEGKSTASSDGLMQDSLVLINDGWVYDDGTTIDSINLPHCWNAIDAMDAVPGYRRGKSTYSKKLKIDEVIDGYQYLLYFEGANLKTKVSINGKAVGEHIGGYVGFEIDITEGLKAGDNKIEIEVDNSVDRELIPSQKSDFFIYGGITRDLWLKIRPEGVMEDFIPRITHIDGNKFKVSADLIPNEDGHLVALELLDGDSTLQLSAATDNGEFEFEIPELWSPSNPKLYTLRTHEINGDTKVYEKSKKIGFRYSEFKENGAYYLNGEPLLIRGTHRHEEHAGVAAAMTNEMHYDDMKSIKYMGCNFVRLAHYPQDPEVYKACDELGLLVWDELPWCRGGVGNDVWKENARRLFTEQINQNIHHPSVIMWSVGNEMYWDPDFEGGGNTDSVAAFVKELVALSKKLDPTRPTCLRKFYEGADLVDVFSPSIWAGWYRGEMKEYTDALDDAKTKYPRFVHMEYGAASHLGRHDENELAVQIDGGWEEDATKLGIKSMASRGTWSETYAVDLFDWHLHISESRPDFTGNAQWAFKDFGTPLRPENPIPYVNQKGVMDRAGNPKDAFYVFKSYWNETDKFAYIQSHTWTTRYGKKGEKKSIRVYSNYDKLELVVNDKSYGSKNRDKEIFPAQGYSWQVILEEGSNTIIVKSEGKVVDQMEVEYVTQEVGRAAEIVLEKLEKDGKTYVLAKVVDENGLVVSDYREYLYFAPIGTVQLLGNQGTPDGSLIIEPMSGKAMVQVIGGTGQVEVRNQDFKGAYISIKN